MKKSSSRARTRPRPRRGPDRTDDGRDSAAQGTVASGRVRTGKPQGRSRALKHGHNGRQGDRKMEGQALRVTLAGTMYQRGSRWWWWVRLPGEDRARPRPLKVKGARAAASDRKTAETIAFEMWEQAVREQAARQIEAQSGQKLATLKAQFLDKVRHFTEIVERATAKAEAEARARAEAEAKLAQLAQNGGRTAEDAGPGTKDKGPIGDCRLPTGDWNRSPDPQSATPDATVRSTSAPSRGPQSAIDNLQSGVGCCECCGAMSIPAAQLKQIDSGQWLCPRCLAALQADAARIQPHASVERPAW